MSLEPMRLFRYLIFGLLAARPALAAADGSDRLLLFFWEKVTAASNDCAAVVTLCRNFAAEPPAAPLIPVVRGVQAWNELAAARTEEAAATFRSLLATGETTAVTAAADTMARRWLTRLDRERVRAALSAYYAAHVGFPASLAALKQLPPDRQPPLADRWDRPWGYRLVPFERLRGLKDQRYELFSEELGQTSDLKAALAAVTERGVPALKPVRVISRQPGPSVVEFRSADTPPRKVLLAEGSRSDNFHFVKLIELSVLFSDGDRWWLVKLP